MICGDCGETNKPGTEFCMFCGAYLGWQEQENPAGANDATQVLPAQPPAPVRASAEAPPARAAQTTAATAPAPVRPEPRPQPAARAPDTVRPAPPPPPAATVAAPPPPPAPSGCPTCGRAIDASRRFCAHCGEQFVWPGTTAPVTRPTTRRNTWWTRLWDSKDRVARRAYRRSLPPLYRWRRVIIAVLALGLIGGGLAVVGRSPKAFFQARYYDLRHTLVPVSGVTATIIPPEASAPDTTPDALVDATAKAWQMNWTASTQGSPCNATPTTPVIQLSFARTRIREIDLRAGLLDDNPNRLLQFRPQKIWVAYADTCQEVTLQDVARQPVPLDTEVGVDSLRIGVQTAFPPDQPTGAQQVLGFTEITLRSRPPTR